mmetsp:Transcript_24403/g.83421  ORF Transcript_24403/g.83421 Transcript_24403/m.83421 type:complete len:123 (+) Transcript_24403:226-594(+)|eukprot:CAMPEP_0183789250 /NCGR_PEP_ID=MMETSP0803_2-20130417/307_1 /TAXON_ID=195967 /ORGANISM="Crustomastix stigmata, Strain CCMP3273" /LENGTH=122 /DNA_ID=CAMNT_0026033417 /DNA_START=222 /DNA_END=590 /DNA_ORIENTATION=+
MSEEVQVTWEDQQRIITFGRLNNRFHEINAELTVQKKRDEDLEDAVNEVMITDEEEIKYAIGNTFISCDQDSCESRLSIEQTECADRSELLNIELSETQASMKVIKEALYGKFGASINLEED